MRNTLTSAATSLVDNERGASWLVSVTLTTSYARRTDPIEATLGPVSTTDRLRPDPGLPFQGRSLRLIPRGDRGVEPNNQKRSSPVPELSFRVRTSPTNVHLRGAEWDGSPVQRPLLR